VNEHDPLRGHRFGVSDKPGIDRCACGYERELRILEPQGDYPRLNARWFYRLKNAKRLREVGLTHGEEISEGDWPWPCPILRSGTVA
jgi:hypothetical protein